MGRGRRKKRRVQSATRGNAVPEIKVISTTAMKTSLDELAPQFERETGHQLSCSYGPSARVTKQVSDGEQNDITITTDKGIDDLTAQGRIAAGTRADLASSAMALAVQ